MVWLGRGNMWGGATEILYEPGVRADCNCSGLISEGVDEQEF